MWDEELNMKPVRNNYQDKVFDDLFDFDYDGESDDLAVPPLSREEWNAIFPELTDAERYDMYRKRLDDPLEVWYEGEREEKEAFVKKYEEKNGLDAKDR